MEHGYRVYVDDNFHYMDKSECWVLGDYATYEEALAASRKIVEDFFEDGDPCTPSKEAYQAYIMMGDDPYIIPLGAAPWPSTRFSAWGYAKEYTKIHFGKKKEAK